MAAGQARSPSTQHPAPSASKLPPIPRTTGPLAIQLVYPGPTDVIDAGDSNFVFGQVGDGRAKLTVNGQEVKVAPNGAFLGWIRIPSDTSFTLEFEAVRGADTVRTSHLARRTVRFVPPDAGPWLDTMSVQPRGRIWWPRTEALPVLLRAAPNAIVQIRMPDGSVTALSNDPRLAEVPWGTRAFETDSTKLVRPVATDRYAGTVTGLVIGDPGPLLGVRQPSTPVPAPPPLRPPSRSSSAPTPSDGSGRCRWPRSTPPPAR